MTLAWPASIAAPPPGKTTGPWSWRASAKPLPAGFEALALAAAPPQHLQQLRQRGLQRGLERMRRVDDEHSAGREALAPIRFPRDIPVVRLPDRQRRMQPGFPGLCGD